MLVGRGTGGAGRRRSRADGGPSFRQARAATNLPLPRGRIDSKAHRLQTGRAGRPSSAPGCPRQGSGPFSWVSCPPTGALTWLERSILPFTFIRSHMRAMARDLGAVAGIVRRLVVGVDSRKCGALGGVERTGMDPTEC